MMQRVRVLLLLLFTCFSAAPPAAADSNSHLVTAPQPLAVEIGTNFTATCSIIDTTEVTADSLYWNVSQVTVPRGQYTRINSTALSVTVQVSDAKSEWLFCLCKKVSAYVSLNQGRFMHGIFLKKGYRPRKPENLSCIALQVGTSFSPTITCSWVAAGRQTKDVPTEFTLHLKVVNDASFNVSTVGDSASVSLPTFPNYMELEIWVEAKNQLGAVESERLQREAGYFVKTKPPGNIQIIPESLFPTSLLINWTRPIKKQYVGLMYEIRFCQRESLRWTNVPYVDTNKDIQSFRLQNLRPDTVYVTQVRCKNNREGHGHWSDWSSNATERTPEDRPTSKPDLWKIDADGGRRVQFICKDPVLSNGKIIRFNMKVQQDKVKNGSWELESLPVNRSAAGGRLLPAGATALKQVVLADTASVRVNVTAVNSVGESAGALLFIPQKGHELPPVEELRARLHGGHIWLEWTPPRAGVRVTEYVVQWDSGDRMDWQRESRDNTSAVLKGDLKKFVCYNVSVYPVYGGWVGQAATVHAYLEQGVPLDAPTVQLKPGRDQAELVWTKIPPSQQQGFITHYTIFYTSGGEPHSVIVPSNTTSYTLTSLSRNTKYDMWISASTVAGSKKGFSHSFTTLKYAPGEMERIVVGASLGFVFVVVMTMVLCISKKDAIKRNFWPQIPNPGESTIGNWSPDYPSKAETPKENCLSGISVLDVDMCDGKTVFDEDKTSLPLKKDKYLSEEHSSGIGGSSCMSSPRQSVSDSDEGGDLADTTASTVQYSSVVASNGYKGQTPSSQPQPAIFSRSESTQPLLDCEESADVSVQEGSRQSQRFLRRPAANDPSDFNRLPEVLEPLDFCPLEEDPEPTLADERSADRPPTAAAASSYMPQLGGYRQQ